jgi:Predicted ATPase
MAAYIAEERAGIVAWCVRGVERYLSQGGYTIPDSSKSLLANWESEIDSVNQWVTEMCGLELPMFEANLLEYAGVRATYKVYREWCSEVGRSPVGEKEFSSRCEARGIEKRTCAKGYVLPILKDGDDDVIRF